ncbi:MAG TPA: hypothetical protein VL401_02215 [Alphaproteobacteria bacterium]|jgi:hypothetical protein|nr:hypothetical protein [Alphaproteobacteria bacterium]
MTNLTRVAIGARKGIRYGIFLIIFILVGKVILDASIAIYLKTFPPAPPPPTVKFGKLTKIPFPANNITAKLNYTLETPEGGLPTNIPTQAKVFFMPKISANLLALDVAKEKAKSLNFTSDAEQVSDIIYKFKNTDFPSTLQMNIITGTFSISYDLASDRTPIESRPPVAEVAASEFRSTLSSANVLPEDLSGLTTHNFLKLSGGNLVTALSLSESDMVKINLFRKNYDNLPSVTGNPNEANVWALIGGSDNRDQQIIASEYHYHSVDESQFSTYPIKTPAQAFSELQTQPFIADLGVNKDGANLKIRRIYLAYFDPEEASDFYQPVYVFEGDNGFTAYVPAVTGDYYGQ